MEFQPGKKTRSGYLALPEGGKGAGVLVLHAWWGLNDFFVGMCERLAQEGFVALAPDLYDGAIASTIEEAQQLQKEVPFEPMQEKALQALDILRNYPGVEGEQVGVLGCSMGASWAVLLSETRAAEIAAAVLFYGLGEADYTVARSAYLGHFAENDLWDPVEQARMVEAEMRSAGRDVTFYVYPGVGHWFIEENRPDAYHVESAQLAWERTNAFLKAHLRRD